MDAMDFVKAAVLGTTVVVVTPMLEKFMTFIPASLALGNVTLATVLSAGIVAMVGNLVIAKYWK